jgi:Ca-activated chloride channel family protein
MIFKDSSYFWLMVILLLIIAVIVIGIRRRRMFIESLGDVEIIKKITRWVSSTKRFWKNILILLGLALVVTAIARPQIGVEKLRIKRKGVDIFVLLDTSLSMAAQDLKPDRLTRAKIWISTLIDNLVNDRIGIIAFAGKPFLQCPLTTDYSASRMLLEIINVGTIPVQGTNIAGAINLAIESFPEKKGYFKVIILVTDGEDHEGKVMEAVETAAEEGIKIIAVGIGSETGEPLPIKDEKGLISEYKKDQEGRLVMSKLNREVLESIAQKTGGAYFSATYVRFDMGKVVRILERMEKEEFGEEWLERFEDRFAYPLMCAIILLCLELTLTDRVFRFRERRRNE